MRLTKFSQVMIVGVFGLVTMSGQVQSAGVVAKVNGVEIPQSRLELMVKANVAQGQPDGQQWDCQYGRGGSRHRRPSATRGSPSINRGCCHRPYRIPPDPAIQGANVNRMNLGR